MVATALLIDWENLTIALRNGGYRFTTPDLARQLREEALSAAASSGGGVPSLEAAAAFAPATALNPYTMQALVANGIKPDTTRSHKAAADLAIAIRGMQLYYRQGSPVRFFIIVSGDADYAHLVEQLNTGGSQCQWWAIDEEQTSKSIKGDPSISYVVDRLGIAKLPPGRTGDRRLAFLLLTHRLLDNGVYFGGENQTIQSLADLRIDNWNHDDISDWWQSMKRDHQIARFRDSLGEMRLRLAYEQSADVLRPLWMADLLVQHVYRRDTNRGQALAFLEQLGIRTADDQEKFLDGLIETGYLITAGDRYLTIPSARYGLIGASIRIAFACYAVTARGQSGLGQHQVAKSHWPRFYKPGGALRDDEVPEAAEHAALAVRRAIATRVVSRGTVTLPNGKEVPSLILDSSHEIVAFMRRNLRRILKELAGLGASESQGIDSPTFINHMWSRQNPWAPAETTEWLGLLAAERAVVWSKGMIRLGNAQLRKEIESWA